jgi:hypothetical protein
MTQDPSWDSEIHSVTQEFPHVLCNVKFTMAHAVAQLVAAPRYKPEGGGFDS